MKNFRELLNQKRFGIKNYSNEEISNLSDKQIKELLAIKDEDQLTEQTVTRAYRRRSLEVHPDKNPDRREDAQREFQVLGMLKDEALGRANGTRKQQDRIQPTQNESVNNKRPSDFFSQREQLKRAKYNDPRVDEKFTKFYKDFTDQNVEYLLGELLKEILKKPNRQTTRAYKHKEFGWGLGFDNDENNQNLGADISSIFRGFNENQNYRPQSRPIMIIILPQELFCPFYTERVQNKNVNYLPTSHRDFLDKRGINNFSSSPRDFLGKKDVHHSPFSSRLGKKDVVSPRAGVGIFDALFGGGHNLSHSSGSARQ